MKTKVTLLFFVLLLNTSFLIAQKNSVKSKVYIDSQGVMRWQNKEEVKGFGVNYTAPFAHAYRSAEALKIDVKKAIDNDVYHFSRLGFDLYRIHVWDTEISDTLGNLIQNEHLDTFDYLLKKLKEKNINFVITPIAFWGNGWPEPDTKTPGFSNKYGKSDCLTNPEAIKAQHNYLYQFLNHVNPYTGVAYKNEPNLIAFEISNEPHHRGEAKLVTKFIKGMVKSMRKTGCDKPIFYNVSHAVQFMDAYFKAGIQGGTFQWYPTGLGYQRELSGNLLPNVNDYSIPFDEIIRKNKGAKLVYEFDAADVGRSYIYPVMARSFRTAGIQIGTHFAYEPTYLAYANTEYNTHYMNLVYTPQKALSLMIASEVFHQIPMYSKFEEYPNNTSFGDFRIDYKTDLAEYNAKEKFIYTNTTSSKIVDEESLNKIAGFGNSELISYDGLGAYFLDKLSDGVWRLEVMPDAIWVDNPFGRNSLKKAVAVIKWNEWRMNLNLENLGKNFTIETINEGNEFSPKVTETSFNIKPGAYILSKKGIEKTWEATDIWKNNQLKDYFATENTVDKIYVNHSPIPEISEGFPLEISAQIVTPKTPTSINLIVNNGYNRKVLKMERASGYNYTVTIPHEIITKGYLKYAISVNENGTSHTFPADKEGNLFDWDFYDRNFYETTIVPKENPIYLFNAKTDSDLLVKEWRNAFKLLPTKNENEAEYQINIEKLFVVDNENLNAKPIYDYSFKHFIIDKIEGRKADLLSLENIVFYGNSLNNKPCKLQIAFVMSDGNSFGNVIEIGTELTEYKLDFTNLKPVKTVTLPRPYPSFLPYYLSHNLTSKFNIIEVESIQFSIGPEIPEDELKNEHGISIISIKLQ